MDYIPPEPTTSSSEKQFIIKELILRMLSAIIPEEILRDGLDERTRTMLTDVMLATAIMMFIVCSDKVCFRVQNKRDLGLMNDALGEEEVTDEMLNWTKEDIDELSKLAIRKRREMR